MCGDYNKHNLFVPCPQREWWPAVWWPAVRHRLTNVYILPCSTSMTLLLRVFGQLNSKQNTSFIPSLLSCSLSGIDTGKVELRSSRNRDVCRQVVLKWSGRVLS